MTEVLAYTNQSIDLLCKLMEWFLYNRDPFQIFVFMFQIRWQALNRELSP